MRSGKLDHDVLSLDGYRVGLSEIGTLNQPLLRFSRLGIRTNFLEIRSSLDFDRVASGAHPFWVYPGLSGLDVELPPVPGTAQKLALSSVVILARNSGGREAREPTGTQGPALVRAAISEREQFPVDIENTDRASFNLHYLSCAGKNRLDCRDDVSTTHGVSMVPGEAENAQPGHPQRMRVTATNRSPAAVGRRRISTSISAGRP